jgi:hypothetical protein
MAPPLLVEGGNRKLLALEQASFRQRELERPRHADPRRLTRFGAKAYSQSDEDGILAEIFRRIGTEHCRFLEIGVHNGMECNSLWLLMQGWTGSWIEASATSCIQIGATHKHWLEPGALRLNNQRATAENVDNLVAEGGDAGQLDLLSIDIDFNDYWVWEALQCAAPRVVVIEYNASWPPPAAITIPYDAEAEWKGDNRFGASLAALAALGRRKGYDLVGCSLSGVNAFFVRRDLVADKFLNPGSADEHYEPPRYFLCPLLSGHPAAVGPVVRVD